MPAKGTISVEEERNLIRVTQERLSVDPKDPVGLDARDRVIAANMRIATTLRLRVYREAHGISVEDSDQLVWIGLLKAVMGFDLVRFKTFSTYAFWKVMGEYANEVGKPGRHRSSVVFCDLSSCDVVYRLPVAEEEFDANLVHSVLRSWMSSKLGRRRARLLRARFGISGKSPMTLEQCGKRRHISKERARQIQRDAMVLFRRDYLNRKSVSGGKEASLARA